MKPFLLLSILMTFCGCIQMLPDNDKVVYCKDVKMAIAWRNDYSEKNNLPIEYKNEAGMRFVLIPPGTYQIGSPLTETPRNKNEKQHLVTITKGYYMGVTEVTQAEWLQIRSENPSKFTGNDLPVEQVLYEDATKYARDYTNNGNIKYRLPTEAEWEIACKAGTITPFNGTDALEQMGWFHENSENKTHPVATKTPNAFGLYDMHGNVWEWTTDTSGEYPEDLVTDPKITNTGGGNHVKRGGSYVTSSSVCRSAYRNLYSPLVFRQGNTGFRLVFEAELLKPH